MTSQRSNRGKWCVLFIPLALALALMAFPCNQFFACNQLPITNL